MTAQELPQELPQEANLVSVAGLTVRFPIRTGVLQRTTGHVHAVENVSFSLRSGETLGLVGESGSGKTTVGRAIVRLLPGYAEVDGAVTFDDSDILALDAPRLRRVRRRMQMVFQDPYGSLNPRMRVTDLLADPIEVHGLHEGPAKEDRIVELLTLVGLDPGLRQRYPHAFSGGQRQRIAIARALSVNPDFIVCDEPVTALDVSIQAQILNVLAELQQRLGLTYLFIAHDLAVVRHMSDRVGVMYLGRIVEIGRANTLYEQPSHPYTRALVSAIPQAKPKSTTSVRRVILRGDIPSPAAPPPGCRFHTRCWLYEQLGKPETCRETEPSLKPGPSGTDVACHFADESASATVLDPRASRD